MDVLIFLIPIALALGGLGLLAFFWSLKNGQYEDLEKEGHRIIEQDDDRPPASSVPSAVNTAPEKQDS